MTLSTQDARQLLEHLRHEEEIYAGLRDLSRRQMDIIESDGDAEKLLDVLGRKQVLLNRVEDVEREIAPYKRDWSELRETLDPSTREEIEERVNAVQEVLAEVLRLEEESQTLLLSRQHEISQDIRRISRGRRAQRAYGGTRPRHGRAASGGGVIDNRG